jgi:hypothetical protein
MQKIGADLNQWIEYERTFVHTRMWDLDVRFSKNFFTIEKEIQIDRTRPVANRVGTNPPKRPLHEVELRQ